MGKILASAKAIEELRVGGIDELQRTYESFFKKMGPRYEP